MAFVAPLIGSLGSALGGGTAAAAGAGAGAASGILGTGISAGTALSAGSALLSGVAASQQAKNQADLMKDAAQQNLRAAAIEAAKTRRKNRQMAARERAGAVESGTFSGTTLDILDDNAVTREMDALTMEYNGRTRNAAAQAEAGSMRVQSPLYLAGGLMTGAGRLIDPFNFQ